MSVKNCLDPDMFRGRICEALRLTGLVLCLCVASGCANQPVWRSGFENGFPGSEWLDYDNGSYSPAGTMPADRVSAWTIVNRHSGEPVFAGDHAYKGWVTGSASELHRAYPVIYTDISTPLVNTLMVFVDTDYDLMSLTDWIGLGGWGNYNPTTKTGTWALNTMAIRNRKLEFAHVSPFHGEYIGPAPQPEFPLRRWVRLTAYLIYQGTTGFVQVWQDGIPMLRAHVSKLAQFPGYRLHSTHWGMYSSHTLTRGVQYNDEIRICALNEPLADLVREPWCPPSPLQRSAR